MKAKKLLALLAAFAVIAVVFAGCDVSDEESASEPSTEIVYTALD